MSEMVRTPLRTRVGAGTQSSREEGVGEAFTEAFDPGLLRSYTQAGARTVPTRALAGAVASWFALVFAICYLAIPAMASLAGLYHGMLPNLVVNTLAFIPMAILTAALVTMLRPKVVTNVSAARDPVVAATLGSLGMWAIGQEVSPLLQSLSTMPLYETVTFTGMNIIESGLFGMMLASFVRSPVKAFALGAAFQGLFLFLFVGWIF